MRRDNYKRLGEYIAPYLEKNVGLKVTLSQGINNNKYFQTPRQVAVDSENDQIVRTGQFAYNKATTRNGEKISIAYREGPDCTVSSAYQVFYITDENKLNPHYLLMWFKRPEFDRYARFKSFGSAHEFFTWEEMCNVYLPVPNIDEQRKIVAEYQAVEQRIENNNRLIKALEDTAQAIYHHTFVENIDSDNLPEGWELGTLGGLAEIKNGKAINPEDGDFPIYGGNGIIGNASVSNAEDVVVIGRVGVNCGSLYLHQGCCYVNDNAMMAIPMDSNLIFLYCTMKKMDLNSQSEGSGQPLLTQSILYRQKCLIPPKELRIKFEEKTMLLYTHKSSINQENEKLSKLKSLLLAKMGQ